MNTKAYSAFVPGILLMLGVGVWVVGMESLHAQSPMDECRPHYSGELCMSGEVCMFFFCWKWETFWRGPGDRIAGNPVECPPYPPGWPCGFH